MATPTASVTPSHTGRISGWLANRLPLQDTQLLTQNNVYILPTRAGLALVATLLVLLVASINFELNLGYLLTFLLAGAAAVGMYLGHGTLRGTTLHLAPPEPAFAGSAAVLDIQLSSARAAPRHALAVAVRGSQAYSWTDVPGGGMATVQVSFVPPGRGLHAVPMLTAETRFPLGTFRVWTVWRPAAQVLVYPAPETPAPPLPTGASTAGNAPVQAQARGPGEIDGLRAYQRGDPLRMVVWKKAARAIAAGSDDLVSRDTHHTQQQDLWFDLAHTGAPALEQRLSRLCAWVLQAERLGVPYGLRLPGATLQPAQGPAHQRQCLEALARC
ncbi:DUF58 domain-containing protein [Xylophilus sp. GW821-FHT01B05]